MKQIILFVAGLMLSLAIYSQDIETVGKLYSQREYQKAIDLGLEELKGYPNHPNLNLLVGRAYADFMQFKTAIPFLEKGTVVEDNPDWVRAWSYGYLGNCYYATGEYQKSKEALNSCVKLNATKNATSYAQKRIDAFQLSSFYSDWEIVETETIRFHFQKSKNIADVGLFVSARVKAYEDINRFFSATPYKKIDFYVWDNPKQAKKKLGQELGFANSNLCIINSRNNQTRGHEIAHILVTYGTSPIKTTRLINEGVATYFDQTSRDRMQVAREALGGKELHIIDLWENLKNYPDEYNYTIGAALIAYLLEKGNEQQLRSLLKEQTVTSARNIYQDFDSLIADFTAMLKQ